ncbi:hypothetical protein BOC40_34055 [Burkholderia pseudomallei]|nr:hypothetical protein BOC40_34055 [Burkholderia pseudomallei]ARL19072.1 hypothetical protein BOC46_27180 [Burkholderia pseudomallei]ARL44227.1 hypothetical protein BOC50_14655 [Burkholderia pseudomallei]ARL55370.1 hypothetical protein BOC52_00915 [Burkholderia pseudomallei]ARL63262.1 hypothetical protein BOC53_06960 [Burkholderia pseudomallei]
MREAQGGEHVCGADRVDEARRRASRERGGELPELPELPAPPPIRTRCADARIRLRRFPPFNLSVDTAWRRARAP